MAHDGAVSEFRRDLYRGAAASYDAFRPSYPDSLVADLLDRTPNGRRRLLDLGCGTGLVALALAHAYD